MMKQIEDIGKVSEYIKQIYSLKPMYSNYFGQALDSNDFYCKTDHTLLIIKPVDDYFRIYILSGNLEDAVKQLSSLEGTNVINTPFKGNIEHWEQLMHLSGYKKIGVYERYYNTKIQEREKKPIIYAEIEQEQAIYDLFHNSGFFSPYTDYLPSHAELRQLIEQKNVIINETGGFIQGAFIFSITGIKCYFRAWIDKSENSLKLLFDIYNLMFAKGLNYSYLWVNVENVKVKTIHQLMGAKPDGLKDYTFIKQQTKQ